MTTTEASGKQKTLNELMEQIRLLVAAHLNKPANILDLKLELSNTTADFGRLSAHCSMWKGGLKVINLNTKEILMEFWCSPTAYGSIEYMAQDFYKKIVRTIAEGAGVLPKDTAGQKRLYLQL